MREFNEADIGKFDEMVYEHSFSTKYDSKFYKIIKNEFYQKLRKLKDSFCIMEDANFGECNEIINAHSIQNNGVLNFLAVNGFVVDLEKLNVTQNEDLNKLLVGKNEATIFRGFCKKHDEVFSEIENKAYGANKPLQNYLFAYRAFAKSYFNNAKASSFYRDYITDWIDSQKLQKILVKHSDIPIADKDTLEKRKTIVEARHNERLKQLEKNNKFYDDLRIVFHNNLLKARYYKIQTLELEFEVENVFACSDEVYIINDFEGKIFNREFKYPIYISVFPLGEKTKVLLSYFKMHATYLEGVIKAIEKANVIDQEIMISNILIKKAKNIVFNPKEFKKFSKENIATIAAHLNRDIMYPGEKLVTLNINLFRPK